MSMKSCGVCKVEKHESAFTVRRASVDGLSYTCRDCGRIRGKANYELNKGAYKARAAKWAHSNRASRRQIVKKNDAKFAARRSADAKIRNARRRAQDIEAVRLAGRVQQAIRRARIAKTGGVVTARWWQLLIDFFETGVCVYCGALGRKLVMDHFVPIAKGGRHELGNLIPVCQSCNSQKSARLPDEFLGVEGANSVRVFLNATRETWLEAQADGRA